MRLFLLTFLLSLNVFCSQAYADYMPPVEEVEIAPGVRAWGPAVEVMKELNATNHIVELYKKFSPSKSEGLDVSVISDECFSVFVNTLDGRPNIITQIRVKNLKRCYKN